MKLSKGSEGSMRGSRFFRDSVDLLHYHLQKISLKRGGLYIDYPKWLKNKKATINLKNNDDKCFQYALTAALNYQNIKSHPERIFNLKPFIDQYNCKGIKLEYKSKHNFKRENQVILLMITDRLLILL